MNEPDRLVSLGRIFKRDIEDNPGFNFRGKLIYPTKGDLPAMQILFKHLTCLDTIIEEPGGNTYRKRVFEMDRSIRLHWIRHHIEERAPAVIQIFSVMERDQKKRKDVIKTYIYDTNKQYIIVLEPQRTGNSYYLITAYHLNKPEGRESIEKKCKKRLPDIH